MSLTPGTPNKPTTGDGALTPGGIANEFSKLDLPAPTSLKLNLPTLSKVNTNTSNTFNPSFNSNPNSTMDTGDISGPEPEAITEMRRKTRSESMSEQISEAFAALRLPQPERIFGPDEVDSEEGGKKSKGRGGVKAEDWEKVMVDEVPEAVKEPVRMSHSRNTSRV